MMQGEPVPKDQSETVQIRDDGDTCSRILSIIEKLNHVKDIHALLDAVLHQARQLTRADAGSIYSSRITLNFSYIQNDTLFRRLQQQ
jgi:hypothetical protein